MSIGDNIKKIRKEKGYTQEQLAKKLGVSQQNLAQYENNKRNPKMETLQKIANSLDTHILVLLGQISERYALTLSDDNGDIEAAYMTILKSIYDKIDIKQVKEGGVIGYNYILGSGQNEIEISDLTLANLSESIENLIIAYINTSKEDFDSQDCFYLMYAIKDMNLEKIRSLTQYATFLNNDKTIANHRGNHSE